MNFSDLYKKIATIDGVLKESAVVECGDMPPMASTPSHQPMTMSINVNAQGEDDISSLMRLLTKVNPDMMPQTDSSPVVSPELSIGGPGPKVSSPVDDIKGDMMKLLPLDQDDGEDLDGADLGGDDNGMSAAQGDVDNDGDHDMDDHEAEDESIEPEDDDIITHLNKELKPYDDQVAKDKETEEGAYDANTTPKPEYKDSDYMNNKLAGGMNKPKATFPKVAGGDNPMQKVKEELAAALAAYKAQ